MRARWSCTTRSRSIVCAAGSYASVFTPYARVTSAPSTGALTSTVGRPRQVARAAASRAVNRPVDSSTTSTPRSRPRAAPPARARPAPGCGGRRRRACPRRPRPGRPNAAECGVVREQVRERVGGGQVVDGDDLEVVAAPCEQGAERVAADAAESVDGDASHVEFLSFRAPCSRAGRHGSSGGNASVRKDLATTAATARSVLERPPVLARRRAEDPLEVRPQVRAGAEARPSAAPARCRGPTAPAVPGPGRRAPAAPTASACTRCPPRTGARTCAPTPWRSVRAPRASAARRGAGAPTPGCPRTRPRAARARCAARTAPGRRCGTGPLTSRRADVVRQRHAVVAAARCAGTGRSRTRRQPTVSTRPASTNSTFSSTSTSGYRSRSTRV